MRYKPYPKYKASGVEWLGEIPEGWNVLDLKFGAQLELSNIDKHSVAGEPQVQLCNYVDVYRNERITSSLPFMQATASQDQIERLTLQKGDVIITKDSESPDDIGISAFVEETSENLVCGYHLCLIRPDENRFSGRLLHWFFSSQSAKSYFYTEAVGMTRFALGKYSIANTFLPHPPLPTQRAIAAFLDAETARIDGLIQDYEDLIELLKEKRQALISRAVTRGLSELVSPDDPEFGEWVKPVKFKDSGVEWIGEIPEGWEAGALKKWLSVVDCKHLTAEFVDSGYALVSIRELQGHVVDISEAKHTTVEYFNKLIDGGRELRKRDLVFCRNVGVGQVSIVPEMPNECAMGQDVCRLRPLGPNTDSSFILLVLKSASIVSQLESIMIGATFKRVNVEQIRELCVTSPDIEEQHAIAS